MLKFNFQQNPSKTPSNRIYKSKKRANSSKKFQKTPDIITQVKPLYLNNFIKPVNPHPLAFTPTNHSNLLQNKKFLLPNKSKEFINKKTLILDLDETLVHSSFVPFEKSDIILDVEFDFVIYNIYVLIRPGAIEFIKKVAKLYELVVFTASISKYALPLLDIIDVDKNIKYKLTREHCTFLNGIYIKELKKLNRNLNDIIILDNSPLAYSFDNDNGLPIKAWYEDKNDNELDKVFPLIDFLSNVKDVKKFIKQFVINNEINFDVANDLIKLFNENINKFNISNSFVSKKNKTKENEKIVNNIKQNNRIHEKEINNNNKENNNNNVNLKKEDKLIKNNHKPSKGILINNIAHIPSYRNITTNNQKQIIYNNYIMKQNLKNTNKTTSTSLSNKYNTKESNLKANIQYQKKKNTFRISSKLNDKMKTNNLIKTNKIHSKNNNIYSLNNNKFLVNNNENEFFYTNALSKTTKDNTCPKGKIQYNINIEANNILKNNKKNSFMRNQSFPEKGNAINFNNINKKYKYTNLLEKLERRTIKTNFSLNNINSNIRYKSSLLTSKNNTKTKSLNSQNNLKKKLNHVGSFLICKYDGFKINNLIDNYKFLSSNTVTRSKSTGSFINLNKNHKKPKSSKIRYNFEKNLSILSNKDNNKYYKNRALNLLDNFPKTTANKEFNYLMNDDNKNNIW